MKSKEQAVLLKELCSEPVFMRRSECSTLPVFRSRRVLRNQFKGQLANGRRAFCHSLVAVRCRVLRFPHLYFLCQIQDLIKKQRVGEQRPAVDNKASRLLRIHRAESSNADSRSTSTSPTSSSNFSLSVVSIACKRSGWADRSAPRKVRN